MCATPEEIKTIVREELLEYTPVLIAKGIKEAGSHLRMSEDTRTEVKNINNALGEHERRIASLEEMTKKSVAFHERIEPLLTAIQKDIDFRNGFKNRLFTVSKYIGAIAVILGSFFAGVEYVAKHFVI